jgi:NADH dehydrogenase
MILLLGATGSLGSQVLTRLIKNRWPVRVLKSGEQDWQSSYADDLKYQGVQVYYGGFNDLERLEDAFRDCTAVVNTIGLLNTKTYEDLRVANLDIVSTILEMVLKCNVQRVVQVSCLGANQNSSSEYLKLKWLAEAKVRECKALWTILKPSYMFGEKFQLLDLVKPLIQFRPCLPIIGSGLNLIQPIWVEDVADCILLSLYDKTTVQQTYELAGPETFSMIEFLELFRRKAGLSGPTVNLPSVASAYATNLLAKAVQSQIVHPDLIQLITADSVSERNDLKDKFDIKGSPLTKSLSLLPK